MKNKISIEKRKALEIIAEKLEKQEREYKQQLYKDRYAENDRMIITTFESMIAEKMKKREIKKLIEEIADLRRSRGVYVQNDYKHKNIYEEIYEEDEDYM